MERKPSTTSNTSNASGAGPGKPAAFDLRLLAQRAAVARAARPPSGEEPFREGEGVDFPVDDPDVAAED